MKKWTRTLLSERGRERRETKLAERSRASFLNDNGCKVIKKNHIQSVFASFVFLFGGLNPPCVWSDWFPFSSSDEQNPVDSQSHTDSVRSAEQRGALQ